MGRAPVMKKTSHYCTDWKSDHAKRVRRNSALTSQYCETFVRCCKLDLGNELTIANDLLSKELWISAHIVDMSSTPWFLELQYLSIYVIYLYQLIDFLVCAKVAVKAVAGNQITGQISVL